MSYTRTKAKINDYVDNNILHFNQLAPMAQLELVCLFMHEATRYDLPEKLDIPAPLFKIMSRLIMPELEQDVDAVTEFCDEASKLFIAQFEDAIEAMFSINWHLKKFNQGLFGRSKSASGMHYNSPLTPQVENEYGSHFPQTGSPIVFSPAKDGGSGA